MPYPPKPKDPLTTPSYTLARPDAPPRVPSSRGDRFAPLTGAPTAAERTAASIQAAEELYAPIVAAASAKDIKAFQRLHNNATIQFNPPAIAYASGAAAYNDAKYSTIKKSRDASARDSSLSYAARRPGWRPAGRDDVLNSGSQIQRMTMKGSLIPDVSFLPDWSSMSTESNDTPYSANSTKDRLTVLKELGSGFLLYGFRFPFNPASLDFSLSSTSNVNIGYIMSSTTSAMPTGLSTDGGGQISLQIPLSRVDDMMAISKFKSVDKKYVGRSLINEETVNYTVSDIMQLYGSAAGSRVTSEDLEGIVQRGTMYDIEFLLRACLGRPWSTKYRGVTADVGLLFGVPLILTLGSLDGKWQGGLRYRVRLAGISFSHKSFTPNMVPLYTELSLSFDRIPDVIGVAK
jgi:hypothetical protein